MKRRYLYIKRKQSHIPILDYLLYILVFGLFFLIMKSLFFQGSVIGNHVSPFLEVNGTLLQSQGKPYVVAGYNLFQIATYPGHNAGCGSFVSDIDSLFSTLPKNSMIRIWAWQGSMAINPKTKVLDWAGVDRVLAAAQKYHQKVIVSLGTQSGECDDGQWKGSSWYAGGYRDVANGNGLTPLSYWDYLQQIVNRYRSSTSIGMWELINEPEASDCVGYTGRDCYGHQVCPDHDSAARIMRQFFDTVGGKVKQIDHNHLIESGLIGTGQCGSDNDNYTFLHKSPAIDVASYHDYNDDDSPMPGDRWNGLAVRILQMKSIGKPLIVGELGILASKDGRSCATFDQRKDKVLTKMDALYAGGVSGILLWDRTVSPEASCNYDIGNNDPLVSSVNDYQIN